MHPRFPLGHSANLLLPQIHQSAHLRQRKSIYGSHSDTLLIYSCPRYLPSWYPPTYNNVSISDSFYITNRLTYYHPSWQMHSTIHLPTYDMSPISRGRRLVQVFSLVVRTRGEGIGLSMRIDIYMVVGYINANQYLCK